MPETLELRQALEREFPLTNRALDWDNVLHRAATRRAQTKHGLVLRLAAAAAVVLAAGLFAFAPWKPAERTGVLDRALAQIGTGHVVHVVVRVYPQGTVIDLTTGQRARAYADIEQWYEPGVGLRQRVIRANGSLEPGNLPFIRSVRPQYAEALRGFTTDYREALESGDAQVIGKATMLGRTVFWVRLRPDAARAQVEVAVDAASYRPLYLRERIGGKIRPGSRSRILDVGALSAVPIAAPPAVEPGGPPTMFGIERTGRLTLEEAGSFIGRPGLWLGPEHSGLPLAWVGGLKYSEGQVQKWSQIKDHWRGLELVYGEVDNFGFPVRTETYIRIEEQTRPSGAPGGFAPEGTLVSHGRSGVARLNGVTVYIEAPTEDSVIAAARALRPLSAGSGAGG